MSPIPRLMTQMTHLTRVIYLSHLPTRDQNLTPSCTNRFYAVSFLVRQLPTIRRSAVMWGAFNKSQLAVLTISSRSARVTQMNHLPTLTTNSVELHNRNEKILDTIIKRPLDPPVVLPTCSSCLQRTTETTLTLCPTKMPLMAHMTHTKRTTSPRLS